MRDCCFGLYNKELKPVLEQWCRECHIKVCTFSYNSDEKRITIYTNKPGWMIGRGGEAVAKYRAMFPPRLVQHVAFVEVDGGVSVND